MALQYLILSFGSGTVIQLTDIYFIKASENGVLIQLKDGKQIKEWKSLTQIAQLLADQLDFFQVHRSYIVNKKYISVIRANKLHLHDSHMIPIGITFKERVHQWVKHNKTEQK
jgi:DNA-binding LytR/AlgR family response regulator